MNSKILCFILSACFAGYIFAQTITDISKDKLKGNVRSVQLESYEAKRESTTPVKSIHLETYLAKYTREGIKERTDYLSGTGSLTYQATYKRDAYNNIILETILDPKGQALGKTFYNYNDKGLVSEEYIFSGYNELESVIYYYYDKKGNCIKKIFTDDNHNTTEIRVYSYDSENRLVNIQINSAEGKKKTDISYEYDGNKNPVVSNTFDYTQTDVRLKADIFEYEYDNKGNWTRKLQYRMDKDKLVPHYIEERKIEYYEN